MMAAHAAPRPLSRPRRPDARLVFFSLIRISGVRMLERARGLEDFQAAACLAVSPRVRLAPSLRKPV